MTPGDRPETWQLMALAYVDGELDRVSQIEVEVWIRTRPEVAEFVADLRDMSRMNRALRDASARPESTDLTRSGEVISARLRPQISERKRLSWLRSVAVIGFTAAIAAALFFACPPDHNCHVVVPTQPVGVPPVDPLAEFDDLPIASSEEVRVSMVRGDVEPGFIACDALLPDLLELATVEDVQIERTGRSAYSVPRPGDSPMIFQTRAAK